MEDDMVRSGSNLESVLVASLERFASRDGRNLCGVVGNQSLQPSLVVGERVVAIEPDIGSGGKLTLGAGDTVDREGLLGLRQTAVPVGLVSEILLALLSQDGLQVRDQGRVVQLQGLELGKGCGCDADVDVTTNDFVVGEVVESKGLLVGSQSSQLGFILDIDANDAVVIEGCRKGGGKSQGWRHESGHGHDGSKRELHGWELCEGGGRGTERLKKEKVLDNGQDKKVKGGVTCSYLYAVFVISPLVVMVEARWWAEVHNIQRRMRQELNSLLYTIIL